MKISRKPIVSRTIAKFPIEYDIQLDYELKAEIADIFDVSSYDVTLDKITMLYDGTYGLNYNVTIDVSEIVYDSIDKNSTPAMYKLLEDGYLVVDSEITVEHGGIPTVEYKYDVNSVGISREMPNEEAQPLFKSLGKEVEGIFDYIISKLEANKETLLGLCSLYVSYDSVDEYYDESEDEFEDDYIVYDR